MKMRLMNGHAEQLNVVSFYFCRTAPLPFILNKTGTNSVFIYPGLTKAEYAVGYFTEMGIGCRRDPLEANVWYVKAADAGDERAKHRLAAIRAAVSGETDATDPKKKTKKS